MGTLQYTLVSSTGALFSEEPLGERLITASLNTFIGLFTVFAVLILITVLIYLFKFIPNENNKKIKAQKEIKPVDNIIAQIVEQEEINLTDNSELIAVITAAIHASMEESNLVPADGFIVRSIRRSVKRG